MGGVDRADQFHEYYSVSRSSYKWYTDIFWFLIDVSMCNAFVLCNYHRLSQGMGKFGTGLAKQLIGGYSSWVSAAQSSKRHKIDAHLLQEGNAGKHFIDKIKGRKRHCVQCMRVGTKTPKGRHVETTFECVQCGVALCKEVCFADYHML